MNATETKRFKAMEAENAKLRKQNCKSKVKANPGFVLISEFDEDSGILSLRVNVNEMSESPVNDSGTMIDLERAGGRFNSHWITFPGTDIVLMARFARYLGKAKK